MSRKKGYTKRGKEDVLEAIQGSGGVMLVIAKKLGVTWSTAQRWVEKWEETRQAFQDEKETILDVADMKLIELVKGGDLGAIKWLQQIFGKHRGYAIRQEHTGADGGAIEVKTNEWFSSLPDDKVAKILTVLYEGDTTGEDTAGDNSTPDG